MINNRSHWCWKLGLTSSWAIAGALIELPGGIITSSGNHAFAQTVLNPTVRHSSFQAVTGRSLFNKFNNIDFDAFIERSPNSGGFFYVRTTPVTIEPSVNSVTNNDIRTFRPSNLPELTEHRLNFEAVDVNKLIFQSCSTKSEFFVTGRGGLPPTPGEVLRSDPALVDLGPPAPTQEMHRGSQRPIRGYSIKNYSSSVANNSTNSPAAIITEAQGWVASSNGEVVLTVQAPDVKPRSPWITSASCYKPQTFSKDSSASVLITSSNVD